LVILPGGVDRSNFRNQEGVSKVTPRVYKREGNFTILGVDF